MRECGADRAHVAHHVQAPVFVPLLVGHLLESGLPRDAHVVYEHVEASERGDRLGDCPLGLASLAEIGGDVQRLPDPGRTAAPAGDDLRPFGEEQARRL